MVGAHVHQDRAGVGAVIYIDHGNFERYQPFGRRELNRVSGLDVLLRGESLRGSVYQAIYMKGRVSWDSAAIDQYARAHPEVLKFRREGQPSVSLRKSA